MEDFYYNTIYEANAADYPNNFITFFTMEKDSEGLMLLKCFYYAFTSLTTVGLGDFRPVSSVEQGFCGLMLFSGVLVFSYIMGEYINLLEQYKDSQLEYDEGDHLKLFFGVLAHFNNNVVIEYDFQKAMEDYFSHRWVSSRTLAF